MYNNVLVHNECIEIAVSYASESNVMQMLHFVRRRHTYCLTMTLQLGIPVTILPVIKCTTVLNIGSSFSRVVFDRLSNASKFIIRLSTWSFALCVASMFNPYGKINPPRRNTPIQLQTCAAEAFQRNAEGRGDTSEHSDAI